MNQINFDTAWDSQLAYNSFERWQDVARKAGWRYDSALDQLLFQVFGASWYFTRYVLFRGQHILPILQNAQQFTHLEQIETHLKIDNTSSSIDDQFSALRIRKNDIMLAILLADISARCSRQEIEHRLTHLAIATFKRALNIYFQDDIEHIDLAILAMGRMAGMEMNYGSDLDMIILCYGELDDHFYQLSKHISKFLRIIAYPSPEGLLYEIDTRLRPHGNSGILITRFAAFKDYHLAVRETWEKQIMTRCRLIAGDQKRLNDNGFESITHTLYQKVDMERLASDIQDMRQTVEKQLGSAPGKYGIKKGMGGLMDIDFIAHYLQLRYGKDDQQFRTPSTRQVLKLVADKNILDKQTASTLLKNYDFLKKLEARVRVFDMKAIDVIDKDFSRHITLAKSMGYKTDDDGVHDFQQNFLSCIQSNRELLQLIVT